MKVKIIFFCIFFFAYILRFWNLANYIPSLTHDEVAIGYNAWSILNTGKDEYGITMPLLFRSFDDYKLPGYIYATVISEKLFGLHAFAVRFPSAFLGFLTVIIFYFFVKEILSISQSKKETEKKVISLVSTALFAISPWHISFSRGAFETNGSLFFFLLGALLLFRSLNSSKVLFFSVISFVISIYFYYTARILVPIILLTFFLIYKKSFIKEKKIIITAFFLGMLLLLPLIPYMFSSGLARINQVSIFTDTKYSQPYKDALMRNHNVLWAKFIYNRRFAYLQEFFINFAKDVSLSFFFVDGLGPYGLVYIWEMPFFLFGIYAICMLKEKWKWVIITWFISIPFIAGFTIDQPNAFRTLLNAPIVSFFTAFGICTIYFSKEVKKKLAFKYISLISLIAFIFFLRFLVLYFDYNPHLVAIDWGDGQKQMADFVKQKIGKYNRIYISGFYWRPYIYMLFYMQYPPSLYQKNGTSMGFANLRFGKAKWEASGINLETGRLDQLVEKKTLFILSDTEFASQENLIISQKRPYTLVVVKQIDGMYVQHPFFAVSIL
jgi:4-amino-4-deoxy-L-arabinose transferase-like glycosyltransferase